MEIDRSKSIGVSNDGIDSILFKLPYEIRRGATDLTFTYETQHLSDNPHESESNAIIIQRFMSHMPDLLPRVHTNVLRRELFRALRASPH